ncbi:MAG TPA: GNAT family N-acetyltransferase [Methylomirabilota bacterium]|jgi:ribosomal protein S18 acetylase RimI-like enzyme|nr:GNAT family N-acetyltransferase [Methylomirabilota bacterium]
MADVATFRRGRREDIEIVLELWIQAGATPKLTDTSEDLARLLGQPQAMLLLAEVDGHVVGTVIGGWDGWRGNIYRLAVLPEYRRRGIAAALMREVDTALADLGVRRITALVEHDHPWAVGFWNALERAGYRHDPTMTRYVKTF